MSQRFVLVLYVLALCGFSVVHDARVLAAGLLLVIVLARPRSMRLLRRAVLAVLFFTMTVSAGVVVAGLLQGQIDTAWLVSANLRVLLLTSLTLLAVERIDLARAVAPSPALSMLLVLAGAQMRLLRRQLDDLRLGLRSRSLSKPTASTVVRLAASSGAQLLGRALLDAEEISLAMRARGAWHVRSE